MIQELVKKKNKKKKKRTRSKKEQDSSLWREIISHKYFFFQQLLREENRKEQAESLQKRLQREIRNHLEGPPTPVSRGQSSTGMLSVQGELLQHLLQDDAETNQSSITSAPAVSWALLAVTVCVLSPLLVLKAGLF